MKSNTPWLRQVARASQAGRTPTQYCPGCCQLWTSALSPLLPPTRLSSSSRLSRKLRNLQDRRRELSSLAQAASVARDVIVGRKNVDPALQGLAIDPLKVVGKELKGLSQNIRQLLGSGHPMLDTVAKYYTQSEGKHVRPLLVLLMSRASALVPGTRPPSQPSLDRSISPEQVLADVNPDIPQASLTDPPRAIPSSDILASQCRLAEIIELIHTASLLHDDVIDHSTTRRSLASANIEFGNKMAVLAGDFLLGRASIALARLRHSEVTELIATVIANLIEGEFMQLQNTATDESYPVYSDSAFEYYLQKTYLKSASLISKSCRAAAILGGCEQPVIEAAYSYGKNLGLAFQLVDDMLDYTVSGSELGKPAGADLELGLATAPLLFAWKDNADLGELVGRKFAKEGDVHKARDMVLSTQGVEQTRALAQEYADKAIAAISWFPDSEAKSGLYEMCEKTMNRRK